MSEKERSCERCGLPISARAHGRRRFCSDRCAQRAYNATRRTRPFSEADVVRYQARVVRSPGDEHGCWAWDGRVDADGYGVCNAGAHEVRAHRFGWQLAHPGDGLLASDVIRHTCDHPWCQQPRHLLKGTTQENVADRVERERCSLREARPAAKLSTEAVQQIAAAYATGAVSQQELADRYEVSRSVVGGIVRGQGWKSVAKTDTRAALVVRKAEQPYHVRGETHPATRVTAEDVREIRRRYAAGGETQASLAAAFGVDRTTIGNIVSRKTWGHIE